MNERWTIEQLALMVEMALDVSGYDGQQSGRVRSLPDLRTIRYYTTLGLLDPPAEMRGRKAFYGRRHLVQLVAIKRLQSSGLSLVQVQQELAGRDDRALAELAQLPTDFWQRATVVPKVSTKSPAAAARSAGPNGRPQDAEASAGPRGPFWSVESALPSARLAEERPDALLAVHLHVTEGVELVLAGIDPARWDPETIARLKGPLEDLARTLRELKLT